MKSKKPVAKKPFKIDEAKKEEDLVSEQNPF